MVLKLIPQKGFKIKHPHSVNYHFNKKKKKFSPIFFSICQMIIYVVLWGFVLV